MIDADYRGEILIILFNFNDKEFVIQKRDRVAQLIIEKIYFPSVKEVLNLSESVRNVNGVSSSGK